MADSSFDVAVYVGRFQPFHLGHLALLKHALSVAPRVVLAGYFVRYPLGGYAWQALHFLAGFRRLGCDVLCYEDSAYYADASVPGAPAMQADDYAYGVDQAATFFEAHGCGDAWVCWDAVDDRYFGAERERTRATLHDCELLVNLGGVNRIGRDRCPRATYAYVDLDPAYTQLRLHGGDELLRTMIAEHDVYFTLGENIGRAGCRIPTCGVDWRPLRQPVPHPPRR